MSRRKVLSQSVAGAIGLSAFGFGVDVVGAKSVESRPLVEELDGPEAKRVLSQLRRTNEYRELGSRLRERGARVQFTPRHTTVIRATQSVNPASVNAEKGRTTENNYHTVELAYTKVLDSNTDEAYLTIGRDAETGVIDVAGLEFVEKEVKGPEDLPVDAEENVSPTKVPVEVTLVDATGKGVETETLDFDDIVTSRISSTGDRTNAADVLGPAHSTRSGWSSSVSGDRRVTVSSVLVRLLTPAEPLHELTHMVFAYPFADVHYVRDDVGPRTQIDWQTGTPVLWVRLAHLAPTLLGMAILALTIIEWSRVAALVEWLGRGAAIAMGSSTASVEMTMLVALVLVVNWILFTWPSRGDRRPFEK